MQGYQSIGANPGRLPISDVDTILGKVRAHPEPSLLAAALIPRLEEVRRGDRELVVEGEWQDPGAGALLSLLQALVGWSLLRGLLRLAARYLLGARQQVRLRLQDDMVKLLRTRALRGRIMQQQELNLRADSLLGWGMERRSSFVLLLIGLASFCTGGVLGLFILFDSLQAGFPLFGLIGLLVMGLGMGLDLGLFAIMRSGLTRTSIWLDLPKQGRLGVHRVPEAKARELLGALDRVAQHAAASRGELRTLPSDGSPTKRSLGDT